MKTEATTFVQLAMKEPMSIRMRPLRPNQPWHILIARGERTACGRSFLSVATASTKPQGKICRRCQERFMDGAR